MMRFTISRPAPIFLRFGKLAPRLDYRTLKFAKYGDNMALPPASFDNLQSVYAKLAITDPQVLFPMDGNDKYGDCTIAGIAHATTVYNGMIANKKIPTENEVTSYYFGMTKCRKDTGLAMLDVLKKWKKKGFTNEKMLAYVMIDPKNHIHVKQAIQRFGGVYMGFNVQEQAIYDFENGIIWTPGTLLNEGHAVYVTSYGEYLTILTWGNIQKATWTWWDCCVDECYAILPPEAQISGFAPGFDFETLKADLFAISN